MSKYTMSIKKLCELLYEQHTGTAIQITSVNIDDAIQTIKPYIFNFNYKFEPDLKSDFEFRFIKNFFYREICVAPWERWHLRLEVKFNEIMPKYSVLLEKLKSEHFDLFNNEYKNRTKTGSRSHTGTDRVTRSSTGSSSDTHTIRRTLTDKSGFSNAPEGSISDIMNYSNLSEFNYSDKSENSTDSISKSDSKNDNDVTTYDSGENDSETETITGSTGKYNFELYKQFATEFETITTQIFKDCEKLFFGLY